MADPTKAKKQFTRWIERVLQLSDGWVKITNIAYEASLVHGVTELAVRKQLRLMIEHEPPLVEHEKAEDRVKWITTPKKA